MTLNEESLIARAHRIAVSAFCEANVVVAIPAPDARGPLGDELRRLGATTFAYAGEEADVLGRFHACAHEHRWHPDSVIVRYTADDPFKTVDALRRVAAGERLPVEMGGEAFTLAMLDAAHERGVRFIRPPGLPDLAVREHITYALFPTKPPLPPMDRVWTIDTLQDLNSCRRLLGEAVPPPPLPELA